MCKNSAEVKLLAGDPAGISNTHLRNEFFISSQ
jgi:hypothetical protein